MAGTPLVAPVLPGPLDGVTVAVKDLFAVAGERLGAGNPVWLAEQQPQQASAPVVDALLAAGAEITGIARTDEFAYGLSGQNAHYGAAPNPAVPGGVSGGSTSGPASAVALGQVAVGLGTDTAGSIRVPASYQGLVGIRTTHGAVGTTGVLPLAPSFDTVGWLSRDTGTALRVAEVLVRRPATGGQAREREARRCALAPGPDARAAPPTRTVVLPVAEAHAATDVGSACAARRGELVTAGLLPATVTTDLAARTLEAWFTAFRTVQAFEAWQSHGKWIAAHPGALGPDVGARFAAAARVTATQAEEASGVVAQARDQLRELLDGAVLVLPATAGGAPALDASPAVVRAERAGTLRLACLAPLAGAPAVSLPLLRTADGRPAGLSLVGAPGTDLDLLRLATTLEGSPV